MYVPKCPVWYSVCYILRVSVLQLFCVPTLFSVFDSNTFKWLSCYSVYSGTQTFLCQTSLAVSSVFNNFCPPFHYVLAALFLWEGSKVVVFRGVERQFGQFYESFSRVQLDRVSWPIVISRNCAVYDRVIWYWNMQSGVDGAAYDFLKVFLRLLQRVQFCTSICEKYPFTFQ